MRLSPFPFRFMTRVTLTSRIGSSARERYPHPPSVTKKWHRTDLAKQALSIRYIAQHCPNLICLTFVPSATKLTKTKMSGLDAITFSLLELVQKCEKLQTLRFQYLAWDPKPTAASVEALELWEVDEYGVQDGLKGVPVQRVLDVGGVPMWLREDEVAEWAMDVMLDIRHHKRDYGL
ncbi:hypothetical protein BU16DRAFT_359810 [Lophium mytilinum]|uniref:Uncharacterized protein n=1 Tax=Lophium mytilinum TaxID=390894 RepID=A0A6A6QTQ2_9PEZI|nr:hypothetical protein BU16DRAFT_359810 [Lophium mytilinum]